MLPTGITYVAKYYDIITKILHGMISPLPRCYTVCFPHYQDVTLYDFVFTRMLYRVFSSLPGCYTVSFLHYQDVIPCVFLTTRMLHCVFSSLPGCYTVCFPHYQDVIPCVFLTTRMLHCIISSSPGCYTVCFPHYQDVTLHHFFITRMLLHIISYLCILPSWNRTHNRQGIHNRMFRVNPCISHPLCQLLYHLHDKCEHQDPNTRHLINSKRMVGCVYSLLSRSPKLSCPFK